MRKMKKLKDVLFVESYIENKFLKISAFLSHKNVGNEGRFRAGFDKVIYNAAGDNTKVNQIIFKSGLNYFQKKCGKWNDKFEIQNKIVFVVR